MSELIDSASRLNRLSLAPGIPPLTQVSGRWRLLRTR
jgi:hypothetical protein